MYSLLTVLRPGLALEHTTDMDWALERCKGRKGCTIVGTFPNGERKVLWSN